jgi:hypothetical protein
MSTIKEALLKLDPTNDDLWTEDGLPRVDVLSALVGKALERKDVTDAAPLFTRANPVVDGESAKPVEGAAEETDKSEFVSTATDEDAARANARATIKELEEELVMMDRAQAQLTAARDRNIKDLEKARQQLARLSPADSPSAVIQNYLASQKANRAAVVANVAALRQTGITPDMFRVRAPIDEALKGKR